MANDKRVLFGTGYKYDPNKTQDENWEALKEYYSTKGIEIGDMPKDDENIVKLFEELKPQFERELENGKNK
jgi:hypothetical protein